MCSEFEYKTNNSSYCGLLLLLLLLLVVLLSFVCNYKNPKHRQKLICSVAHKITHTQHQRPVQNSLHFRNNQTSKHFCMGKCVCAGGRAFCAIQDVLLCFVCCFGAIVAHLCTLLQFDFRAAVTHDPNHTQFPTLSFFLA